MSNIVQGGYNVYGYKLGVIMLDTVFPRIKGDIGNAETWNFPVLYKTVKNALPHKVVLELTKSDIEPFILAAKELESRGVKAITTSCGFLALFQEEMQKELSVPVFTSALVQLPFIRGIINPKKKILILTANSKTLTQRHLESACGSLKDISYKIVGTEDKPTFTWFTVENREKVDLDLCRQDIILSLDEELNKKNDYGAILLECTNMPPYSDFIRQRYNLPVFDIVTLANFVVSTF